VTSAGGGQAGERKARKWVIDSIEEHVAAVEVDGRDMFHVPVWLLPEGAREGDVLSVEHDREGRESRVTITIDSDAGSEAIERSRAQAARRPAGDAGGNITL
jgi:hypothetical protein